MKSKDEIPTVFYIGEPIASELETAERLLVLSAMPETVDAEEDGKLVSLCPQMDGNIVVTSGRIGEKSLSRLLGVPHLPILMANSRAAYLYMVQAHEGEQGTVHCSLVETLARSRTKVWVHRGRDLAKKVCSQCHLCRRRNKVLTGQQMAKIKEESLTMCRPFSFISIDFAGPVRVKGAVNSRARLKCWIIVYCCRSTKAVDLLATCGYDTQSFLLNWCSACQPAPGTARSCMQVSEYHCHLVGVQSLHHHDNLKQSHGKCKCCLPRWTPWTAVDNSPHQIFPPHIPYLLARVARVLLWINPNSSQWASTMPRFVDSFWVETDFKC